MIEGEFFFNSYRLCACRLHQLSSGSSWVSIFRNWQLSAAPLPQALDDHLC